MVRVYLVLLILLCLAPSSVSANSCCGQSPASFVVLSQGQKLSFSTTYSMIQSQGRADNFQNFTVWNNRDREVQALQIGVAGSLTDRSQFFISSSFLRGSFEDGALENGVSENWSDSLIGLSYEVLPEYRFSFWRPTVFLSSFVNVPTGNSIHDETTLSEGADVTGHNQWGAGAGVTARKTLFPFTLTLQAKTMRVFEKNFDGNRVSGFYDSSFLALMNYVTRYGFSVNTGMTLSHLSSRKSGRFQGRSAEVQNTTALLGLQWTTWDSVSWSLSYADQTLLGPARNSILNQVWSLNMNINYF